MTVSPFWEQPLVIEVDGKTLQYMKVSQVDITQRVNNIPNLELRLVRPSSLQIGRWDDVNRDADKCVPGKKVTLRIALPGSLKNVVLFDGIVVSQRITWAGPNPELTLRAVHPLHKLMGQPRSRAYQKTTDQTVIQTLIGEHATAGRIDVKGGEHEQLLQWQSSDWHWLRRRMRACGVWLFPHMDRVDCVTPSLSNGDIFKISGDASENGHPTRIVEAEWYVDNSGLAATIEASCWNVEEQRISEPRRAKPTKLATGGLDPGRVKASIEETWRSFYPLPLMSDDMQHLADGRLLAQEAAAAQVRFVLYANQDTVRYRLGDTLEISSLGERQNGQGIITGIRHQWSRGSFLTTVFIGLDDIAQSDAAALPRADALTVGIVAEYESDATHCDRIRVVLPELGETPIWARFAKPYASAGRGFHLYPESKDEVLVSFIDDDPRFPVILGATHNPVNAAPTSSDQGDHPRFWKGWISESAEAEKPNGINFSNNCVRIETQKGALFVGFDEMDKKDNHRAIVQIGKSGIEAKSENITLSSTNNMTIAAEKEMEILGTMINLKKS
ncbi:uncharacterized protein involved in type VI secretion and phage assembly [Robbsia andropogonis]|uniref:phage baseplate assembly protein V n=1 Tax=Robbsia andropogonis TaxID=28092 RepID=UPI003D2094BD